MDRVKATLKESDAEQILIERDRLELEREKNMDNKWRFDRERKDRRQELKLECQQEEQQKERNSHDKMEVEKFKKNLM